MALMNECIERLLAFPGHIEENFYEPLSPSASPQKLNFDSVTTMKIPEMPTSSSDYSFDVSYSKSGSDFTSSDDELNSSLGVPDFDLDFSLDEGGPTVSANASIIQDW